MNEVLIQKCLLLLQRAMHPMLAIEIANRLGIEGTWECRRRIVRAIIEQLRPPRPGKDSYRPFGEHWIIANLTLGYWLTENESVWRDYNEGRRIEAVTILAEVSQRNKKLQEQKQLALF